MERKRSEFIGLIFAACLIVICIAAILFPSGKITGKAGYSLFEVQNISSCTTIDFPGNYTLNQSLTTDESECIYINTDDVNIDCRGYNITGNDTGIFLNGTSNVTIKNCKINNLVYGIYLFMSSNNTLTNNTLHNNTNEIFLEANSTNNKFYDNLISSYPTTFSFTEYSGNYVYLKGVENPPENPDNLTDISKYLNITGPDWLFLNISYNDSNVLNITNESSLKMYHHNGTDWKEVNGSGVNITNKIVYGNLTKFSIFAPLGAAAVLNQPPIITLIEPRNNDLFKDDFYFEYLVNDADGIGDVQNCELWINNQLFDNNAGGEVLYEVGEQEVNKIRWYVACYDAAGAKGISITRVVYVDDAPPLINISSPEENSSYDDLIINLTATDNHLKNVSIEINDSKNNTVYSNHSEIEDDLLAVEIFRFNETVNISAEYYVLYVDAYDYLENPAEANVSFSIGNSVPEQYCGDKDCNGDEDCKNCPEDCGECKKKSSGGGGGGGSSRTATTTAETPTTSVKTPVVIPREEIIRQQEERKKQEQEEIKEQEEQEIQEIPVVEQEIIKEEIGLFGKAVGFAREHRTSFSITLLVLALATAVVIVGVVSKKTNEKNIKKKQLDRFLILAMRKGHKPSDIKEALVKKGWKKSFVDKYYSNFARKIGK